MPIMRVHAEGPLKTLVLALGVFVVVIALGTYATPFAAEYEVKMAAKTACNELRFATRSNSGDKSWEKNFVSRARQAGVQLREDQYDFEIGVDLDSHDPTCRVIVKWRDSTEAFLIGGIVTELPKLTILHSLDFVHKVRAKY